jgi:predicted dienelactone hydrolase
VVLAGVSEAAAVDPIYDPLVVAADWKAERLELKVIGAERDREIPVRSYLPADKKPAPVVLFSHGLGGSRAGNQYLGEHWSARSYLVVFMQHPGSDESVWQEAPRFQRMAELNRAASAQTTLLRLKDVRPAGFVRCRGGS